MHASNFEDPQGSAANTGQKARTPGSASINRRTARETHAHATFLMPELDPTDLSSVIRIARLCQLLGLSRSMAYLKMSATSPHFDARFPRRVRLGPNSVGWILGDALAYIRALERV